MDKNASPALPIASSRRRWRIAAEYLVVAVVFVAAYGQAPLYYSNQNQYFLHGLASAGVGNLHADWLANTLDPTPVFSAIVVATVRYLHPWFFHGYLAILLAAYAIAMLSIFDGLAGDAAPRSRLIFAVLLVLTHSAAVRWASYQLFDKDYPWFLQAGVAGQYVLGSMLQPSVFGVFILIGLALFVRGRVLLGSAVTAGAGIFHPTYLLPAAMLTLGFMSSLGIAGEYRRMLLVGITALAVAGPVAVFSLRSFGPTNPEVFAEAQDILVNFRIPHHTQPALWFDRVAAAQILWMLVGIALARRTRLFWILLVAFLVAAVLTLVQIVTQSASLALLFPWRVSAVLVPMATAIILARLVVRIVRPSDSITARMVSGFALALLAAGGIWSSFGRHAFSMPPEELPVIEFVRKTAEPGDVYFVPVHVPNLASAVRGSLSSDFKPLPQKLKDAQVIPLDLQRFRLHTGAPIFVDFKSVPYKDVEVIEWRNRIRVAEELQRDLKAGRIEEALTALRRLGVTHLVVPVTEPLRSRGLRLTFGTDTTYRIYRIEPEAKPR
jgi:hypothetical protein